MPKLFITKEECEAILERDNSLFYQYIMSRKIDIDKEFVLSKVRMPNPQIMYVPKVNINSLAATIHSFYGDTNGKDCVHNFTSSGALLHHRSSIINKYIVT